MNFEQLRQELIAEEGREKKAYRCTAGKLTAGIGRNIEEVEFTDDEIELMFSTDYQRVRADLPSIFPNFHKWPQELQHIVFNMRFQLGPKRFRGFKKLIAAAQKLDLAAMEKEMADSVWAKDKKRGTPERAKRLIERVKKLRLGWRVQMLPEVQRKRNFFGLDGGFGESLPGV